jgi:hypothetical protein
LILRLVLVSAEGAVRAQAKKHSVGRHVGNLACARSRGNGAPPLMASRFASITRHRVGIGFPSFDTFRISWVSGKTNCVIDLATLRRQSIDSIIVLLFVIKLGIVRQIPIGRLQ